MRTAPFLFSAILLLVSASARADRECVDMVSPAGIMTCLEFRTGVAEKLVAENLGALVAIVSKKDNAQASTLRANQKAWLSVRNTSCGYALSKTTAGEEQGITEVGCKLDKTLERVKELEELLDAEVAGRNTTFRKTLKGLAENRDPSVSPAAIASPTGVSIINGEFNAAHQALMGSEDVASNRLRIKSLRMIDEGRSGECGKASIYIAELGYSAQRTQKYLKIYVRSFLNKDRTVRAIKTSVQENIDGDPVCP